MNIWDWLLRHWNIWVFLGALGVVIFLIVFWGVILVYFHPSEVAQSAPTAHITLIPAPTLTPAPIFVDLSTQETAESDDVDGISIGDTVQISGTGSAGLRMRSAPGINSTVQFVALESEPYQVMDGPQQADEFTWWYLVSSYDATRSGWAAAEYLSLFTDPE